MSKTPNSGPKPVMSEKERRALALQTALRDNLRRRKGAPPPPVAADPTDTMKDGGDGT